MVETRGLLEIVVSPLSFMVPTQSAFTGNSAPRVFTLVHSRAPTSTQTEPGVTALLFTL